VKRRSGILPIVAFLVLVVATLACGTPAEEWELRGWTVTPSLSQPATTTPTLVVATQTPFIIEVTNTNQPADILCIVAQEAVNLRPSPNITGYPIVALKNGEKVIDLGGRSGTFMFVQIGDKQGWVHGDYVRACRS